MNRKLLLISTACAILGASFGTAYAQDKKTDDDNGTQVGELVITAQKREEKLQDVPVAVTAFSGETRDLLGVVSIFDLTNNTPGLVYSVGLDRSFIRGVGRNTNAPGSDPGIAVYQDGVYSASTVPLGRAPIFSERTEVLRGPQGTLYGRNSIGGAMNIISTRPTDEFQGEVRATYGDHNNRSFQAKIDGPITSWLRYELGTAQIKQTEGFFHNANGGPDEGGPNDEKFYIGALDFNVGEKFDGFVRLESYSYDRRYRGFSPNGGTTVNPTFDDQTVMPEREPALQRLYDGRCDLHQPRSLGDLLQQRQRGRA